MFQQAFTDDDVNFGHFSDMVSAHSHDKSFFRIGLVWESPAERQTKRITIGWLSTFIEEKGVPRLSDYTFFRGTEKVYLRFRGNDIYYREETYETPLTVQGILTSLPQHVDEQSAKSGNYEKVSMGSGGHDRIPIVVALSLVASARESKKRKKREKRERKVELTFPSPDVFSPSEITWIAPIRTKPRRTYDEASFAFSPEGGHTPYLIRRMLRSKAAAARFHAFIEKVGRASGLFQDVKIKNFGRGATVPFEVDIVLDGTALNLSTVGYGVSQSLPVIVELLARGHGTWFAIQQPEVHLHPCAQAALGDVFFEMAASDHKVILAETHSDFTIDRFRMNYKNGRSDKPDSQILFFERRDKHNIVTSIRIGKSGELPSDQPTSYREFFVREELRSLGI